MRTITFAQATLEAMAVTMEEDPAVFVMGEDVARQGGIFGQFKDLARQFPDRVIDTPISETFIVGGGVGAGRCPSGGGYALCGFPQRRNG